MNEHDILAMLQHHETSDDHNFALSTLAICSAGEHIRKRHIRQLIDIALETNQNIGEYSYSANLPENNKLWSIIFNFIRLMK